MACAPSLGNRPVWSESLLSAWRKLRSLATHWTHSEDYDQFGRNDFVGFDMRRLTPVLSGFVIYLMSSLVFVLLFVCLCWGLTSQSTIFQSCRDGATTSWVINQYFRGVKCLAQGHNTAAVGFERCLCCFPLWCLGQNVEFDCIGSWSLPFHLLSSYR